jgi:hypothetical protein
MQKGIQKIPILYIDHTNIPISIDVFYLIINHFKEINKSNSYVNVLINSIRNMTKTMTKNTLIITANAKQTCICQLLSCREPTYVIHAANSNITKRQKVNFIK